MKATLRRGTLNLMPPLFTCRSNDLVACNIYVSAGRKKHAETLLSVLNSSQELCRRLRKENEHESNQNNQIAVVHAYADGPYDRSSFHLAGCADYVAIVASHVATSAIDALQATLLGQNQNAINASNSQHPLVGIVDHISIMPLSTLPGTSENCQKGFGDTDNSHDDSHENEYIPPDSHGIAALSVAHNLRERGVTCYPYGTADKNHMPLAVVRKENTSFFKSGGLSNTPNFTNIDSNRKIQSDTNEGSEHLGICTVGSPSNFVENFNIRLTDKISRKQAMKLTKRVRERDGGLIGVEALTLPYSENRYEVACNLLRPNLGSADCIMEKVHEWVREQPQIIETGDSESAQVENNGSIVQTQDHDRTNYDYYVDEAYRVGTTVDQCMDVISVSDEEGNAVHDSAVLDRFRGFLQ